MKVKTLYGYHTGKPNEDVDPLCKVILNRSTQKVFNHRYWIDSKPRTVKFPKLGNVKIRGRINMSSPVQKQAKKGARIGGTVAG